MLFMAGKVAQPVWDGTIKHRVKLEEYDMFANIEKIQQQGWKPKATTRGASGPPLVIDLENDQPHQLGRNTGIMSPGAKGGRVLAKDVDLSNSRAAENGRPVKAGKSTTHPNGPIPIVGNSVHKASQPNEREKARPFSPHIPLVKGDVHKNLMVMGKSNMPGKKLEQIRNALQNPFKIRPATLSSSCGTPEEGVKAALKMFEEMHPSFPKIFPIRKVLKRLQDKYPFLVDNYENGVVGHVPGVEVGLRLRSRTELSLIGLHKHPRKGIEWKDVKGIRKDGHKESVALSVVFSGGYQDNDDRGETIIYTGEGGREKASKQQEKDQKLDGGNEALYNNIIHQTPVRVIRGRTDINSPSRLIYSYDGLYKVEDWEYVKGIADKMVYRFKLVRESNQKPLVWSSSVPKPFRGHATLKNATTHSRVREEPIGKRRLDVCGEPKGKEVASLDKEDKEIVILSDGESKPDGSIPKGETKGEFMQTLEDEANESEDDYFMFVDGEDVVDGDEGGHVIVHKEVEKSPLHGEGVASTCFDEGGRSSDLEEGEIPIDNGVARTPRHFGDCAKSSELEEGELEEGELCMDDIGEVIPAFCHDVNESTGHPMQEASSDGGGLQKALEDNVPSEVGKFGTDRALHLDDEDHTKSKETKEEEEKDGQDMEDESNDENEYEVERILDKRIRREGNKKVARYLIRWKGYTEEDDTWEQEPNLKNCQEKLKQFQDSRKKRKI